MAAWMKACGVGALGAGGVRTVAHQGRVAAVFAEGGAVVAVDNRCPHMGFPLSKGTLKNGILTCPWHAWQFDASSGACLTQGGCAVRSFRTEIRGDEVWVEFPGPADDWELAHWKGELNEGLEHNSTLRLGKAAFSLLALGVPPRDLVARAVVPAVRYREDFSEGLSILGSMANVVQGVALPEAGRVLALVHGLRSVARSIERTPHRRARGGLPGTKAPFSRRMEWFRGFVHDREEEAAEKTLMSVVLEGAPAQAVEAMLQAAIADFVFLDTGHAIDYTNKAFELLGHVGWAMAPVVLPMLIRPLCQGQRHETDMMWKHPHDLVSIRREAALAMERSSGTEYVRPAFIETVLGDDPEAIGKALVAAGGVPLPELACAVAEAAAIRLARFHTRNEFTDWDWAHHALTSAEAVRRAAVRAPTPHLCRAILDGALYVYLARFLNIPKHPLPGDRYANPWSGRPAADLLVELDRAIGAREAGAVAGPVHAYVQGGHPAPELLRTFVEASIREDLEFHGFQAVDYALGLGQALQGKPGAWVPVAAAARYVAAHSPTPRFVRQTVENAIKLQRGENLHE